MRCKASGCEKPPYLGGFCEAHHKEDQAKAQRRAEAIDLLFRSVVDDDLLRTAELREELERLQRWWQRACQEMRSPGTDPIFGDEAQYAFEWCVILAEDMIGAERATRQGNPPISSRLEITRKRVWERFRNLERGLMSNGVPRPGQRD